MARYARGFTKRFLAWYTRKQRRERNKVILPPSTRLAPNFNGVSQYGVLPDIPILDDGFFMSGKFRPKSLTGNQTIFGVAL